MMKKYYVEPQVSVLSFTTQDVLTASGDTDSPYFNPAWIDNEA